MWIYRKLLYFLWEKQMGFLHGIRKWVIPSFLWKFARKAFLLLYENVTINGPLHVQSHILLHLRRWRMNEGNAWKRPFVEIFRSRTLSTFNVHVTWMEPEYLSRISKLFYPSTHILAKSTNNIDNIKHIIYLRTRDIFTISPT